jgi:hypothetical protein
MKRVARATYWLAPIAFCIVVYRLGLKTWFAQDDFAWLNLRNHVVNFHTFLWAMFAPLAQGTTRPLSERAFFMLFSSFFGLHALPYRVFVFLSQAANIVLIMVVTRKLTKSALAGFLAPILWLSCIAMVTPMAWTAAYNEIQCANFLLFSLYLFIRYTETGERKFYWAQWLTFVLGFGALEINVVYPAIAALYAILFARRYIVLALPMFGASAVFTAVNRLAGPADQNFYYDLDFHPGALINTLAQYWNILLAVPAWVTAQHRPQWWGYAAVLLITAAMLGFAAWQIWKRQLLPVFLAAWFLIVLGPLLLLHNHVTDYYLYIPSIGIAMLAAYAIALAWRSGWAPGVFAGALALLYMVPSIANNHTGMVYYYHRGERAREVVQSVAYAKRIHPGKTILLKDVDDDLFWAVIFDSPFHIFGWTDVFVTPDSRPQIHDDPHFGNIDAYFLPASAVSRALNDGSAVVYTVENRMLRNVTRPYTTFIDSQPEPPLAPNIDVGAAYFKNQVGEGWFGIENGFRWSGKHAVVYLLGPTAAGQKLEAHGFAPEQQIKVGPLHFALTINGRPQPIKTIDRADVAFRLQYDLPADLVGQPKIEVAFTLDRTIRVPTDERALGLAFGEFAIR